MSAQLHNQHLLWRAGFGPALQHINQLEKVSRDSLYKTMVKDSAAPPAYINVAGSFLQDVYDNADNPERKKISEEERRKIAESQRKAIKDLNIAWFKQLVNSKAQLREKMAFFWHGHFACRNQNVFFNQLLLHTIRENALGNFGTLLKQVSHSAAMLSFLNNQQNKKNAPNENFAREVMELFTMGRGHYSEKDIKEAARAFTGWTANAKGEFVFRKNQHDDGSKTILGATGNFGGDEVLDIILQQPQTAKYIVKKIYRYFVNDTENTKHTDWLAERFYKSKYDISILLQDLFLSDWFYAAENIGVIIKSPIELLAGLHRIVPMQLHKDASLLNLQSILGQQLFYPPNVAGWPGGKTWIDSTTLMTRMRIPKMLNDMDALNIKAKQDDDVQMGKNTEGTAPAVKPKAKKNPGATIDALVDWVTYSQKFEKINKEALLDTLQNNLLQSRLKNPKIAEMGIDNSSREAYIKTVSIQLMCMPEYQMA